MLFQSQAENITRLAYRRAVLQSEVLRKADVTRKLAYYNNEQEPFVLAEIKKIYQFPERVDPVFLNITRKVINLISRVYLQDCTRIIDGKKQDQEVYAQIEEQANFPTKMKAADRLSRLLGTIMLRPLWRNGQPDMDILTGDVLDVLTGDSPEDVRAVMVTYAAPNGRSEEIEFTLWTPEEYQRLDYRGRVIEAEPNPYDMIPFVPVWSEPPTSDFWLPGANDLINAQVAIDNRLTDTCYTLRFQSHGVGYIKCGSVAPDTTVNTGPGSVIFLPEKGEVGFAAPNAPIHDGLEAIDKLIKWVAVCNGLPAASLSTDSTEQSGRAKLVGNVELEEQRRDSIALFAKVEQQLFNLWRVVWNIHNPGRQISETATLNCDFFDPKPSVSGYEQAQQMEKLIDMNLASRVDCLIELNPDLSREEAKKRLKEIAAENEEFTPKDPVWTPSFGAYAQEQI